MAADPRPPEQEVTPGEVVALAVAASAATRVITGAPTVAAVGGAAGLAGLADASLDAASALARLSLGTGRSVRRSRARQVGNAVADAYERWSQSRRPAEYVRVRDEMRRRAPWATRSDVDEQASREVRYEQTFLDRAAQRIRDELPRIWDTEDLARRENAIRRLLDRERRYAMMREQAMGVRVEAAVRRMAVRQQSPAGAYWRLDGSVREHTPDCIAFGEKVWPWTVLDVHHPPLHAGCPCTLHPIGHAIAQGWMTAGDLPDPADAVRRAARIARAYQLAEAEGATEDDWAEVLEEALQRSERDWINALRSAGHEDWQAPLALLERRHEWEADGVPGPGKTVTLRKGARTLTVRFGGGESYRPAEVLEEASLDEATARHEAAKAAREILRFGKGTRYGGRFMRKGQTSPGLTRRGNPRKHLRDVLPHAPMSPGEARLLKRGQTHHVKGRRLHVPEATSWRAEIDGTTFTSPPGSTLVYRDGRLAHDGDVALHPDLEAPTTGPDATRTAREADALRVTHEEAQIAKARAAARELDPGRPPVDVGDTGIAHPLEAAGFIEVRSVGAGTGRSLHDFIHPITHSTLKITVRHQGARVEHVQWEPGGHRAPPDPLPDAPPDTFEEFRDRVLTWGRHVARQQGLPDSDTRTVSLDDDLPDHAGRHEWTGDLYLGHDVPRGIDAIHNPDGNPADTYASYQVAAHELGHGINPINPWSYGVDTGAEALEEALTEETSHHLAAERLSAEGLTDVLAWVGAHPDHPSSLGTYWGYRDNLRRLLDHIGVPQAERRDLLFHLKFHLTHEERLDHLSKLSKGNLTADVIASHMDRPTDGNMARPVLDPHPLVANAPAPTPPAGADGEPLHVGATVRLPDGAEGRLAELTADGHAFVWTDDDGGLMVAGRMPRARELTTIRTAPGHRPERARELPAGTGTAMGMDAQKLDLLARLGPGPIPHGGEVRDDLRWDLANTALLDPAGPVADALVAAHGWDTVREWAGVPASPSREPEARLDPRETLPRSPFERSEAGLRDAEARAIHETNLRFRQREALARGLDGSRERAGERGRLAAFAWTSEVEAALHGDRGALAALEGRGIHPDALSEALSAGIKAGRGVVPPGSRLWRQRPVGAPRGASWTPHPVRMTLDRPVDRAGWVTESVDFEHQWPAIALSDTSPSSTVWSVIVDGGLPVRRDRDVAVTTDRRPARMDRWPTRHPRSPGRGGASHPGFRVVPPVPGPSVGVRLNRGDRLEPSETLESHRYERGTGHFGTGVYFVGGPDQAHLHDRERGLVGIDLSEAVLYRPPSEDEGFRLHETLMHVNDMARTGTTELRFNPLGLEGTGRTIRPGDIADRLPPAADGRPRDREALAHLVEQAVAEARADVAAGRMDGDLPATRVMRGLGYDGIDVRGLERLDNTNYGSVLYRPAESLDEPGIDDAHRISASDVPAFVAGARVGGTYYHRTSPENARAILAGGFDLDRGEQGYVGPGAYLSDDPDEWADYGGTTVRVAVALRNPAGDDEWRDALARAGAASAGAGGMLPSAGVTPEQRRRAVELLREAGHDGYHDEGVTVVYDPAAMRVLEPEGSQMPAAAHAGAIRNGRAGRWVWIKGVYRHIPQDQEWEEIADGVRFFSPRGGTEVFRQARPSELPEVGGDLWWLPRVLPGGPHKGRYGGPQTDGSLRWYSDTMEVDSTGIAPDQAYTLVSRAGGRGKHIDVRDPRRGGTRRGQQPPEPGPEPAGRRREAPQPRFEVGQEVQVRPVSRRPFVGKITRVDAATDGRHAYYVLAPDGDQVVVQEAHVSEGPGGPKGAVGITAAIRDDLAHMGQPTPIDGDGRIYDGRDVFFRPDSPRIVDDRLLPDGQLALGRGFFELAPAQRAYELDRAFGRALYARLASPLENGSDLQELQQLWTSGGFRRDTPQGPEWIDRFSLAEAVAETYARLLGSEPAGGRAWAERFPVAARFVGRMAHDRGYMLGDGMDDWLAGRDTRGRAAPPAADHDVVRIAASLEGKTRIEAYSELDAQGFHAGMAVGGVREVFRKVADDGVWVVNLHGDPIERATGVFYPHDGTLEGQEGTPEHLANRAVGLGWIDAGNLLTGEGYQEAIAGRLGRAFISEDTGKVIWLQGGPRYAPDSRVTTARVSGLDHDTYLWALNRRLTANPAAVREDESIDDVIAALGLARSRGGAYGWRTVQEHVTPENIRAITLEKRTGRGADETLTRYRILSVDGVVTAAGRPKSREEGYELAASESAYLEDVEGPLNDGIREAFAARESRVAAHREHIRSVLNARAGAGPSRRQGDVVPAGATYAEVREALRLLGFNSGGNGRRLQSGDLSFSFRRTGPNAARLTIRTNDPGRGAPESEQLTVAGSRVTAAPPEEDLGRVRFDRIPGNLAEAHADNLARADELGERYGARVQVDHVRFGGPGAPGDHAGLYEVWHRRITNGSGMLPSLERVREKIERGARLLGADHEALIWTYSTMQHEIGHSVNYPGGFATSDNGGRGFEEALNEEMAQVLMPEWLASHGLHDTVRYLRDNPRSSPALGRYQKFRRGLRGLLDRAGVVEGDRRIVLERWKFQTDGAARRRELAQLIATREGIDVAQAEAAIDTALEGNSQRGGGHVARFEPILRPDFAAILGDAPEPAPPRPEFRPVRPAEGNWPAAREGEVVMVMAGEGSGSVGQIVDDSDPNNVRVRFTSGPWAERTTTFGGNELAAGVAIRRLGGGLKVGDLVRGPRGSTGTVREVHPNGRINVKYHAGDARGSNYDYDPGSELYEGVERLQPAFHRGEHVRHRDGWDGVVEGTPGPSPAAAIVTVRRLDDNDVRNYDLDDVFDRIERSDGPTPPEPEPAPEGGRPAWLVPRAQVRVHPPEGRPYRGHIVSVDEAAGTALVQKQHRGGRPTVRVTVQIAHVRLHGAPPEPPGPAPSDDRAALRGMELWDRLRVGDVVRFGDGRVARVSRLGTNSLGQGPSGGYIAVAWDVPGYEPPAPHDQFPAFARGAPITHGVRLVEPGPVSAQRVAVRDLRLGDRVRVADTGPGNWRGHTGTVRIDGGQRFIFWDAPYPLDAARSALNDDDVYIGAHLERLGGTAPGPERAGLRGVALARALEPGDRIRLDPPRRWGDEGWWSEPGTFNVVRVNERGSSGLGVVIRDGQGREHNFTYDSLVAEAVAWAGEGGAPPPPPPAPDGPPARPAPIVGRGHNFRSGDLVQAHGRTYRVVNVDKNFVWYAQDQSRYDGRAGRIPHVHAGVRLTLVGYRAPGDEVLGMVGRDVRVRPNTGRGYRGRLVSVDPSTGEAHVRVRGVIRIVGFPMLRREDGSRFTEGMQWGEDGGGPAPPEPGPVPGETGRARITGGGSSGDVAVGARVRGTVSGQRATVTRIEAGRIHIRRDDGTTHASSPNELKAIALTESGDEIAAGDVVTGPNMPQGGTVEEVRWIDPDSPEVKIGSAWVPARGLTRAGPTGPLAQVQGSTGLIDVNPGDRLRLREGHMSPGGTSLRRGTRVRVKGKGLSSWPGGHEVLLVDVDGEELRLTAGQLEPIGEPPRPPQLTDEMIAQAEKLAMAHYRRNTTGGSKARVMGDLVTARPGIEAAVNDWLEANELLGPRGRVRIGDKTYPVGKVLGEINRRRFASEESHAQVGRDHPELVAMVEGLMQSTGVPVADWVNRYEPGPGGRLVPPGPLLDENVLRRTYEGGPFGTQGLTTVVTSVHVSASGASIDGSIKDREGNHIGSFSRRITKEGDGFYVYNASMSIQEGVQGGGFARAFNRQAEATYRAKGVTHVDVTANINIGGYAWAATGFDWKVRGDRAKAEKAAEMVRSALQRRRITQAEFDQILPRLWDGSGSLDGKVVHAWEVANLTSRGGQPHDLGKKILLGTSWPGRKMIAQPQPGAPI